MSKISVVVSVYNEENALEYFYNAFMNVINGIQWDYELIFVDDGSQDYSRNILQEFALKNLKVKIISFTRNFGHEAAMIAG